MLQAEDRARTVQLQVDTWRRAAQALTELQATHAQRAQQADADTERVSCSVLGLSREMSYWLYFALPSVP